MGVNYIKYYYLHVLTKLAIIPVWRAIAIMDVQYNRVGDGISIDVNRQQYSNTQTHDLKSRVNHRYIFNKT